NSKLILLLAVFTVAAVSDVNSSKILFLVSFAGKSHWMMFEHVIYELLNKGHEVTAITHYQLKTDSKNYREIIIDPPWDWDSSFNMTDSFQGGANADVFFKIKSLWDYGLMTTKHAIETENVKSFIENDRTAFDLVISEEFKQESFLMFAHKYNCPLITIGTLDYADYMDQAKGALQPWSHVPHFLSYYDDKMTFIQRLDNTIISLFDVIGRKLYYLPKQNQMAKEAFKSFENQYGPLPTIQQMEKKIAVFLVNSHPVLTHLRPKMPGMIDIAGLHVRPAKPLPKNIEDFINSASDGVIYLSFGSFIRSADMPKEKFDALLGVFKKIKQKVLWKWESDNIPNLPSNVMVQKWLPQSDVLAHKNVKLFIGHGGIFGIQEAIHRGVPMILFPFYGDQHLNGHKMERLNIGLMQSMVDLSTDSLLEAINTIINNKTYYESIERISDIFKSNQNDPLDTAIYWIEYIIKHKGAPHLQSHAKNLPWYRYLLLDVFLVNVLRCILLLGVCFSAAQAYDILVLVPFPSPSHWLFIEHIVKALLGRGHYITAITNYRTKTPHSNYSELIIDPPYDVPLNFSSELLFNAPHSSDFQILYLYWKIGLGSTEHALKTKAVQEFIRNDNSKFDLILAEQFFQDSLLMFSHKYQAPIVTINTIGYSDVLDRMMGSITPYSFVPHMILLDYGDKMNFWQRFHNFMFSMSDVLIRKYYYLPKMNEMVTQHFEHLDGPLPKVEDLEKSISAIFVNSHWSINKPRPLMPGIINVAGSHIKPTKPLPNDIQEFLDGAEEGAIYFSLGSYMQSSKMPKEKVEIILNVFASLKQRILWKYEVENIPNLPENVMIQKWMPQSDILAHPKIILFIAHGGLFGTIEGSFYGVPMLFIPFFGDQYRNAAIAQSSVYALRILFPDINERTFKDKITEMISNKKYYNRAKEVSTLLNDNPIKPMDEAMYWIEYVIRNKGAKHLKSAAVDLPWYQYLMLDVFGLLLMICMITLLIMLKVCNLIFRKSKTNNNKFKKKN
ncbi:unnamed protein product, partial [Diamesa hyperborea]